MSNSERKKRFKKLAIETLESRRVMATLPYGAEPDDTGEFMLGRVAVTPVFLESDGSIDPSTENWTPSHINAVLSNIQTGLNWWTQLLATKSSVHSLEWVIDTTYATTPKSTPYEPIARTSNAYQLWVSRFLTDVGFNKNPGLEDNMRAFNHSQRTKLNTDWSFTIFVCNSVNDPDGSFATGGSFTRAFAFAGGLFEVVPSTRPASTYAHETGHMFWARDEYTGGGTYFQRRGYYNSQNTNALDLNPNSNFQQVPSIMSAGSTLQTAYDTITTADATLAQIGWQDSDGDGIFDVLDVPLKLEGTGRFNPTNSSYRFVGRASVQTLPNRNSSGLQNDITLNRVGRIEYRVANGAWTSLSTPNSYSVDFDFNIPISIPQGKIEIRAIDPRTGITSNVFAGNINNIPDTTTKPGIQGFVWNDDDQSTAWSAGENGLSGASVTLVDGNKQPLQLQKSVEPDDFPNGLFSNNVPGVQLDVIGADSTGSLGIFIDPTPSTGSKIFKPFSLSAGTYADAFKDTNHQLRARFTNPTTYVSIDAISIEDNSDVRLDAFDASGNLIKRVERKGLLADQKVTLELGTDTPQIASVIARAFNGSFIKLDNLRFGPRNSTTTASDGSYAFPYLPAGTYNLLVEPNAPGYNFTTPTTGVMTVNFAAGETLTHIDFGLDREVSPWQNPRLRLDVDDSGDIGPLDVLVLINDINLNGTRTLDGTNLPTPPYLDVNGDRFVTPLDVLEVINFLNQRTSGGGQGGEGETPRLTMLPPTTPKPEVPFTSFVHDPNPNALNTWIISSHRTNRPESGPDKCGCPGCSAWLPAGEASSSILDIASAKRTTTTTTIGPALPSADSALSPELGNVDKLLADWKIG